MKGPAGSGMHDVAGNTQYKRGDREFDPSIEMMINDFDDERTIEEEEALEGAEDPQEELSNLQRESDMPLEELLAMYNYGRSRVEDDVTNNVEESDHENPNLQERENGMEVVNEPCDENGDDSCEETEPRSQLHELYMSYSDDNDDTASRNDDHYSDWEIQVDDSQKRSEILVGVDFQAYVPESLSAYDDALPYENEDKLLWDPNVLSENDVQQYLVKAQSVMSNNSEVIDVSKRKHIQDDEQALYLLLQCGYNLEEALRRRKMNAPSTANTMALWSDEECSNFEAGLKTYGKDFRLIQLDKVRTRSVAELIQFYYLWKKTERCDMFAYKKIMEKKSSVTIPGMVDCMDKHVEQFEIGPIFRDRNISPNINSLIYADPKRQRMQEPGTENTAVPSTSKSSLDQQEKLERRDGEENKSSSQNLPSCSKDITEQKCENINISPTLATTSPTLTSISPTLLTTSPSLLTNSPTGTNVQMAFSSSTLPVPSAASSEVNENTSQAQPVLQ